MVTSPSRKGRHGAPALPPEVLVAIGAALAVYLEPPPKEYRLLVTGPWPAGDPNVPEWNRAGRWENVNRWPNKG